MPDGLLNTFGIALKAYTDLDQASLTKATKTVGDSFGKALSGGKGAQSAKSAVQEGTKETVRWGGSLQRVRDALSATWHTAGLGKAVDQVRDAHEAMREFHDQAEKTSKLFGTAGEGILGLAGVGGIGFALERYASNAGDIFRTSTRFGVSPDVLQRFRGAASIFGIGSESATSALGGLQQSLFGAQYGINATALGAANRLGLDVREGPEQFLLHLAGKMRGQTAQVQREIAEAFGVQDLLPLLQQGTDAVEKYIAAGERHRHLTQQQIDDGQALDESYNSVIQSTLGLSDAVSAHLAPSLTPVLTGFSHWLDDLKQSPSALDTVSKGVEVLATVIGVSLVSALTRATIAANSLWATPLFRFLGTGLGATVAGVGAGLGTFFGGWFGGGHMGQEGQGLGAIKAGDVGGKALLNPNALRNQNGALKTPASILGGSLAQQFAQSGLPPEAQAFMRDIASGEALAFDQLAGDAAGGGLEKYGNRPGYAGFPDWPGMQHMWNGQMVTSHGAGLFQDEPSTWKSIAEGTGLTNFRDPQQQIAGNWWWAQKVYQEASGRDLLADLRSGNLDPRGRGALGSQWGRGSVAGGPLYRQILANLPAPEAGLGFPGDVAAGGYQIASSADTRHEVEVTFVDAPPGMRTGLRKATGPSDLTLRTQTAFSTP